MVSMLIALAASAVVINPPAPLRSARDCGPHGITYAGKTRLPPRVAAPHKLAEEPAATHYLAVARHVGGCPAPAVVRTGIRGR